MAKACGIPASTGFASHRRSYVPSTGVFLVSVCPTATYSGAARVVSGSSTIQRRDRRLASCHNGTFPSSLPRTGRASCPASGSPVWTLRPSWRGASRTAWPWGLSSFPCHPFPCERLSRSPWSGVTPTSTMVAASPWDSRPVGDPVFRFMIDVLAHCRCPVRALSDLIGRGLSYGGYLGQPSNSRHKTATECRRFTVGAARALLSRGVRAIQLSPWCAGLAEPPILQRLRTISAFCTGYVSPFPFGSGLVQWSRNIPPSFSTLRVGSIMSSNGAIQGRRKASCHVGTFPSSPLRTGRAPFDASGSPDWTLHPCRPFACRVPGGLWSFSCHPSSCGRVFPVLPGGARLPRLLWWLCHHEPRGC